jgi:hypothetical protein
MSTKIKRITFALDEEHVSTLLRLALENNLPFRGVEIDDPAPPHPDKLIFISYRRSDSRDASARIYDYLEEVFTRHSLFRDVESIPGGPDFRNVLTENVAACDVMLVIIGPDWLNDENKTRLHDDDDYVRFEIEAALQRGENAVQVIPVLVNNAAMPVKADLPFGLRKLTAKNAVSVRPDPDFRTDVKTKLVDTIRSHF